MSYIRAKRIGLWICTVAISGDWAASAQLSGSQANR
jgi:hypothetical protein